MTLPTRKACKILIDAGFEANVVQVELRDLVHHGGTLLEAINDVEAKWGEPVIEVYVGAAEPNGKSPGPTRHPVHARPLTLRSEWSTPGRGGRGVVISRIGVGYSVFDVIQSYTAGRSVRWFSDVSRPQSSPW